MTQPDLDRRPEVVAISLVAPLWQVHLAADIEIATAHIERGADVHLLRCDGGLASCAARPAKDPDSCVRCRWIQAKAVRAIGLPDANVHTVPEATVPELLPVETFADLMDYGGEAQTGRAAASTLVSALREPEPELTEHASTARAMLASAELVHRWTFDVLQRIGASQLVVFNGRFVNALPAVTAARAAGLPVVAHERNWNGTGFVLRSSGSVHSLAEYGELIEHAKVRVRDEPEARSHAIQWFEGRRFPLGADRLQSFTERQHHGSLPDGFDTAKRNVTVFISSEDEFVALAEWRHYLFETQEDTVRGIATHPDLRSDIHIWVRVHPNLTGLDNAQTRRLHALATEDLPNVAVIEATSPVDSYELADRSDLVVTFGSTIGAEAIYWGRPVLLLGHAVYERLDGIPQPTTLPDAVRLINEGFATPPRDAALPFAVVATETGSRFSRLPGSAGSSTLDIAWFTPPLPLRAWIKLRRTLRSQYRRLRQR